MLLRRIFAKIVTFNVSRRFSLKKNADQADFKLIYPWL